MSDWEYRTFQVDHTYAGQQLSMDETTLFHIFSGLDNLVAIKELDLKPEGWINAEEPGVDYTKKLKYDIVEERGLIRKQKLIIPRYIEVRFKRRR